jgi:hypothetical protein
MQMLPHGVSRALEPIGIGHSLFSSQYFGEAFRKRVEAVGVRDVMVQRRGIELRQDEDFLESGIEAVADRNIDQPVLSSERDSRLRSILSEWE